MHVGRWGKSRWTRVASASAQAYHETLGAEAQRALGMRLHQLVTTRAQQQQGHLAQRLADGWTVLFNYPATIQGAEERACGLALALVAGARELRTPEGADAVTLCIGVHAAVSIVGQDSTQAGQLLAQGEAPTCALRLQGQAEGGQVLLSDAVQRAACSRYAFRACASAQPLRVAGNARQGVHELVGAAEEQASGTGSELGGGGSSAGASPSLVGRDVEIGHLLARPIAVFYLCATRAFDALRDKVKRRAC